MVEVRGSSPCRRTTFKADLWSAFCLPSFKSDYLIVCSADCSRERSPAACFAAAVIWVPPALQTVTVGRSPSELLIDSHLNHK